MGGGASVTESQAALSRLSHHHPPCLPCCPHASAPCSFLIGELDEEKDASIDWSSIKAAPLAPVRFGM